MVQKSTAYKNRWIAEKLDRINFAVPKGEKAEIQKAAARAGESVNGYVLEAVRQRMEKETGE